MHNLYQHHMPNWFLFVLVFFSNWQVVEIRFFSLQTNIKHSSLLSDSFIYFWHCSFKILKFKWISMFLLCSSDRWSNSCSCSCCSNQAWSSKHNYLINGAYKLVASTDNKCPNICKLNYLLESWLAYFLAWWRFHLYMEVFYAYHVK